MPHFSRRGFLQTTGGVLAAGAVQRCYPAPAVAKERDPNSKLQIACIGVGGMGQYSVESVKGERIVALCDVERNNLDRCASQHQGTKTFADFNELLDVMDGKLDAVTVSTPDHMHAPASVAAMRRGLHCYCEKPLAHTVEEIRLMTNIAREKKLFTQMGTQIHAEDNYRRVVELVQAGAIGSIDEVHVWCGVQWGGRPRPSDFPAVPETLSWDLWLGPVPHRPYSPVYFGGNWRAFWAFGNGSLGDMGAHHIDLSYWALDLKYPTAIEATATTPPDYECAPVDMVARYQFPTRGTNPPVTLTWYDGAKRPPILAEQGLPQDWGAGTLFVGKDGMLMADYGRHVLFSEAKFADYKRPEQTIPKSLGHHAEWIHAIKTGNGPTTCDFAYSGPLAETVLLGTVAYRVGKKLEWDGANLKATNAPEADKLIRKVYKDGWSW